VDEVNMGDVEQNILNGSGMIGMVATQRTSDITLSYRIMADSGRVMYALSIPEYIEAWLEAPSTEALQLVFNLEAEQAFRIDLYHAEALQRSVHGSCRIVSANQVSYVWKTTSSLGTHETLVDMQLRYSSGGCILALKHSGFKDVRESAWCCKMWQQSLERLGRIMARN
jgi:uncharacterized protein YndB with AHSA1/START domain